MPSPVTPVPRKPRRVRLAEKDAQNMSAQEVNKQNVTPPLSKHHFSSKDAILSQIDDLSNRISDSAKKVKRAGRNLSTEISFTSLRGKAAVSTPTGTTKRDILGQMDELSRGIDDIRKSTSATKTTKPVSGSVRLSSIPRASIGNGRVDGLIPTAMISPSTLLPQSTVKARPSNNSLYSSSSGTHLSFGDSPVASDKCSEDQQLSGHGEAPSRLSTGIPMFTTTPTTLMEKSVILKKRCDEYEKEVADLKIELDLALKKAVGLSELQQIQQESENENFQLKKELLVTKEDLKETSNQLDEMNSSLSEATRDLATKGEELNRAKEELDTMQAMLSDLEEKENELTEANIQIENLQISIHEQSEKYKKFDEKCEEIEKSCNDRYEMLANAHSILQESQDQVVSAHTELQTRHEKCLVNYDDLSNKYEEILGKYKDLKEKYENIYTDVVPTLQSSLDEATQNISSLEADLEYSQEVNNDLSNSNGQIQGSYQNALNELSSVRLSLQEALETNRSLHESMNDFERDSKSKTEELLKHQRTIIRNTVEVEQATEELEKQKTLNSQLQATFDASQEELRECQTAVAQRIRESEQANEELEKQKTLNSQLQATFDASQEELSSRGNSLEAVQEDLKFMSDTCEEVQKEYDALQSRHKALLEEKNKHEVQHEAVWADLEAAMGTIGELEDDIGKFRSEIASLKDEKEETAQRHQSEIFSLKKQIEEGSFTKIESENIDASYRSEIASLQSDRAELLKKHESEMTLLRKEIEESKSKMEEAIKKGKLMTESMDKVMEKMNEKEAKIEDLSTSYADLQQEQAIDKIKMAREKESAEQANLALQRKINDLVASNKADVAMIHSEKEKLQEELNIVLSEALSMHTAPETAIVEKELIETKKLLEEQRSELQSLQTSNRDSKFSLEIQTEKFQAEIACLQNELDCMRTSSLNVEKSSGEISSLNEALTQSRVDLQESQDSRTQLERTIEELQEQLKKSNKALLLAKDQNSHFSSVFEMDGGVYDYRDSFERASPSSLASSPPPLELVNSSSPTSASSSQAIGPRLFMPFPISDQVETQYSSERIEIQSSASFDTLARAPNSPTAFELDEGGSNKSKKDGTNAVTLSDTLHAHTTGVVGAMRKNFLGWLYPNAKDGTENLGQDMEAYYDEVSGRWIFPGEEDATNELPPPPIHIMAQPEQKSSPSSEKISQASPSPRTKALNSMMAPPPMTMRAGSYSSFASVSSHSSNQSSPSHQQSSRGPSPSFLFPPPTNAVAAPPAPNIRVWSESVTAMSSQNVVLNNINAEVTAPLSKNTAALEKWTATSNDVGSPVENSDSYEMIKNINAGINISDIGLDSRDENDDVDNDHNNDDSINDDNKLCSNSSSGEEAVDDYGDEPFECEVD